MNTPETDAMATMRRTTQDWIDHSARLERERDDLRRQLGEECKSWNTLTNENADLRNENEMLRRSIRP